MQCTGLYYVLCVYMYILCVPNIVHKYCIESIGNMDNIHVHVHVPTMSPSLEQTDPIKVLPAFKLAA